MFLVFQPSMTLLKSSIHGIALIERSTGFSKISTIAILCCCFCFCFWQINSIVEQYLRFDAKSTVKWTEFENLSFPAITFCPSSLFDRSGVGSSPEWYVGYYVLINNLFNKIGEAQVLAERFCYNKSAPSVSVTNDANMTEKTSFTAKKTMEQCQFNGISFKCQSSILQKNTELSSCFIFNPSSNLLHATDGVYGMSPNDIKTFIVRSGRSNSLSFILNIRMKHYCLPVMYDSAGFLAYLHDPTILPMLSLKRFVQLSPGFSTNVAVEYRKSQRYTERLGRCTTNLALKWYSGMEKSKDYTNKDTYVLNCLTDVVVRGCQCLPYFAPPGAGLVQDIVLCGTMDSSKCMNDVLHYDFFVARSCLQHIPVPCNELSMGVAATSTKFPALNIFSSLRRNFQTETNLSYDEFRQNYLIVNFFMKHKIVKVVEEFQKMTWIDFMNQSGGSLGMCLGVSFLSFVELFSMLEYLRIKFVQYLARISTRTLRWKPTYI